MAWRPSNTDAIVRRVLDEPIRPPSAHVPNIPPALDAIVMHGLARDSEQRYATAREMALGLERKVGIATQSELTDWLQSLAGDELRARAARLRKLRERGGVPLRGRTSSPDDARARDTTAAGSIPPSVETRSRATEVRSVWPWFAAGSLAILAILATRLPSSLTEPARRHALAPLAVPAALPQAVRPLQPTQPLMPVPAATERAQPLSPPAARIETASAPPRASSARARRKRALPVASDASRERGASREAGAEVCARDLRGRDSTHQS